MTHHLDLFEDLVRVETRLWNELDVRLRSDHGVALGWLVALRVVAAAPGCRVVDLATDIGISPGGASKLVERLVGAGLVARDADESDRRTSRLTLTPLGRRTTDDCSRTSEEWLAGRFGDALGPDATARLSVVVGTLREQARAQAGVR